MGTFNLRIGLTHLSLMVRFVLVTSVAASFGSGCSGEAADDGSGGSGGLGSSSGGAGTGAEPASAGGNASGGVGTGGAVASGGNGSGGEAALDLPAFCRGRATAPTEGQWQSEWAFYEDDRLTYPADDEGNRIVDFSYAGYHYGEIEPPVVTEAERVAPAEGDDTARIQEALDRVGALTIDALGHRGAVVLEPGTYQIGGTLEIRSDGVVLRGAGDGADPSTNTILQIIGNSPANRTGIRLGSGDGSPWDRGAGALVTDDFVRVGARVLHVTDASGFASGDEVIVRHPSTQAWIDAVEGGGTGADADWGAGTKDLIWVRRIVSVNGDEIELDAPVYNHLDRDLATTEVHPITAKNVRREVGLESVRVDVQTAGGEDENHAHDAVGVVGAEDAWVRDVTTLHFTHAGVFTSGALRVTVTGSTAIEPVGVRTGGRFYNFDAEGQSQLVLFTGCTAADGRHNMIANGANTAAGIVFHRIDSNGNSESEGHRQWSQALLFDSIGGDAAGRVQLISRGDWGTGHGWASAHSVIWSHGGESRAQKPPTAQNYVVSDVGSFGSNNPFPGPLAEYDVRDTGELFPASLYEAQLCERLALGE